jgi:NADPH:quinone reductase-like Zn-dependent oxidoreductase
MPFPAHLSFREAATLPCAAVTAWAALDGIRPVLPGETVMTLGSGGVSLVTIQFAKMFGARTIVVTSSMERAARLGDVGADEVVRRDDDAKWVQTVRDLTGGRGVEHVVETGSIQTLASSVACGQEGAVTTVVAALTPGHISTSILGGSAVIRRNYVGSRAHFSDMNRAIALHRLRPVIDACYDFDDAATAFRRFAERKHFGKVVIADAEPSKDRALASCTAP